MCHTDRDWTKPGAPPIAEMKGADDWLFTISRNGEHLLLQIGLGGPTYELIQFTENEFTAKETPEIIRFGRDESGQVTHLLFNVDDVAPRVPSSNR